MKNKKGFTLIELMVVVAIIGVLAAVAIPAFQKYIMKSRTTEVMTNIRKIYDGEITYYVNDHVLETGQVATKTFVATLCRPWSAPTNQKRSADWSTGGWEHIKFSSDGPVFYSYIVEVGPDSPAGYTEPAWLPEYGYEPGSDVTQGFLARALGDLDGDGEFSSFSRMGLVYEGSDEVQGGAGIYQLDPLE